MAFDSSSSPGPTKRIEDGDFSFDYDGENFTLDLNGESLIGCQWLPQKTPPKFVLIFFHGLGAFLSINRTYFQAVVDEGGVVFGTDHMGHGRSPGYRGYNSMEELHDEIRLLMKRSVAIFPNLPTFIYGHSLGGLSVLSFVLANPLEARKFEGVIIEAPWLYEAADKEGSIVMRIFGMIGRYFPNAMSIETGDGFGNTKYPKKFIEKFNISNLGHDFISPKLYASVENMREIVYKNYRIWPQDLPILFMQGELDTSVGVAKNIKFAESLRDIRPMDVQIVVHKDAEHAMLRCSRGPVIVNEVIDFILGRMSNSSMFPYKG